MRRPTGERTRDPAPSARPFVRWDRSNRSLFLRPATGAWVVVEGVGAEIIEQCDGVRTPEDIARSIAALYAVDPEVARRDVLAYLDRLEAIGFCREPAKMGSDPIFEGLSLHVTARCELDCRHCYASPAAAGKADPPLKQLVSVVEQARALGAETFKLTGGDPLLRPEALEAIAQPATGSSVTVLTNGLAPAEAMARLITEKGWELQISLDGAHAETHDWYRGPGTYARLVANLEALAAQGLTRRVTLSVCLSRANRREIESLVRQAIEWGVRRVHLARISRHGRAAEYWDELTMSPQEWAQTYRDLARIHGQYHERIQLTGFLADYLLSCLAHPATRGCAPGEQVMVDLDGRLYPCIMMGTREMCLGDLGTTSLAECLQGTHLAEIRARCKARLTDEAVCGSCDWRAICRGACPGWPLIQEETLHRTDDLCEVRRELFVELLFELPEVQ